MIVGRDYGLASIYYGDLDPISTTASRMRASPVLQGRPDQARRMSGFDRRVGVGSQPRLGLFRNRSRHRREVRCRDGPFAAGETALWAGAQDERFALVISNNSGCGGAALSRRYFGETVSRSITRSRIGSAAFQAIRQQRERVSGGSTRAYCTHGSRPVYVASAQEDLWPIARRIPVGQVCCPVYRLFGLEGLAADDMPPVNKPLMSLIGYHIRNRQTRYHRLRLGTVLGFRRQVYAEIASASGMRTEKKMSKTKGLSAGRSLAAVRVPLRWERHCR